MRFTILTPSGTTLKTFRSIQSLDFQQNRGFVAFRGFQEWRRMMNDVGVPEVADPSQGLLLGRIGMKINLTSLFLNILRIDPSSTMTYLCN